MAAVLGNALPPLPKVPTKEDEKKPTEMVPVEDISDDSSVEDDGEDAHVPGLSPTTAKNNSLPADGKDGDAAPTKVVALGPSATPKPFFKPPGGSGKLQSTLVPVKADGYTKLLDPTKPGSFKRPSSMKRKKKVAAPAKSQPKPKKRKQGAKMIDDIAEDEDDPEADSDDDGSDAAGSITREELDKDSDPSEASDSNESGDAGGDSDDDQAGKVDPMDEDDDIPEGFGVRSASAKPGRPVRGVRLQRKVDWNAEMLAHARTAKAPATGILALSAMRAGIDSTNDADVGHRAYTIRNRERQKKEKQQGKRRRKPMPIDVSDPEEDAKREDPRPDAKEDSEEELPPPAPVNAAPAASAVDYVGSLQTNGAPKRPKPSAGKMEEEDEEEDDDESAAGDKKTDKPDTDDEDEDEDEDTEDEDEDALKKKEVIMFGGKWDPRSLEKDPGWQQKVASAPFHGVWVCSLSSKAQTKKLNEDMLGPVQFRKVEWEPWSDTADSDTPTGKSADRIFSIGSHKYEQVFTPDLSGKRNPIPYTKLTLSGDNATCELASCVNMRREDLMWFRELKHAGVLDAKTDDPKHWRAFMVSTKPPEDMDGAGDVVLWEVTPKKVAVLARILYRNWQWQNKIVPNEKPSLPAYKQLEENHNGNIHTDGLPIVLWPAYVASMNKHKAATAKKEEEQAELKRAEAEREAADARARAAAEEAKRKAKAERIAKRRARKRKEAEEKKRQEEALAEREAAERKRKEEEEKLAKAAAEEARRARRPKKKKRGGEEKGGQEGSVSEIAPEQAEEPPPKRHKAESAVESKEEEDLTVDACTRALSMTYFRNADARWGGRNDPYAQLFRALSGRIIKAVDEDDKSSLKRLYLFFNSVNMAHDDLAAGDIDLSRTIMSISRIAGEIRRLTPSASPHTILDQMGILLATNHTNGCKEFISCAVRVTAARPTRETSEDFMASAF